MHSECDPVGVSASRTNLRRLAVAAVLGAAVALPVGMMVGSKQAEQAPGEADTQRRSAGTPGIRNSYSPKFRSDPYVISEQKRVVEALESSCREQKLYCEEARQARLRVEEAEAGK